MREATGYSSLGAAYPAEWKRSFGRKGTSLPQALGEYSSDCAIAPGDCLRYIFEIVDDEGHRRAYVASHMYRKADKLIVLHRGAEVGIDICRICDWCAVDDDVQRARSAETGWLHDC